MLRDYRMSWSVMVVLGILVAVSVIIQACRSPQRTTDASQTQLLEWMEQKSALCILDVRTADEYASGHIPGAINISHQDISAHIKELTAYKEKNIVVYCQSGRRARIAQNVLAKAGFPNVYHLRGDMTAWRKAGRPTEAGTRLGE